MGLQEIANMNQEEILKRIQTIIVEVVGLGTPPKLKDRLFADLGADSLHAVEIALAIEKEFEIRASDEEKERVTDVASIVALVKKKTS
jgi:acyl carrier protein